jgi:hypothetical protein
MMPNRRGFVLSSSASILLTVTKASSQEAPRKIGLVHSTGFTDEFMTCFLQALSDKKWGTSAGEKPISHNPPTSAAAKYGPGVGHGALRTAIKAHGNVHLIVAAGGLMTQAAAYDHSFRVLERTGALDGGVDQVLRRGPEHGRTIP